MCPRWPPAGAAFVVSAPTDILVFTLWVLPRESCARFAGACPTTWLISAADPAARTLHATLRRPRGPRTRIAASIVSRVPSRRAHTQLEIAQQDRASASYAESCGFKSRSPNPRAPLSRTRFFVSRAPPKKPYTQTCWFDSSLPHHCGGSSLTEKAFHS